MNSNDRSGPLRPTEERDQVYQTRHYSSPPPNTSSPLATKTHRLTTPPTTIPINTPPTHALLLASVTCALVAKRTTHPAFFPRPGIQASHQQLSSKPVNWITEVATTKTALAVARSLPRRRERTARAARRVLGRRWEISRRREWRWERYAESVSVSQATVAVRP